MFCSEGTSLVESSNSEVDKIGPYEKKALLKEDINNFKSSTAAAERIFSHVPPISVFSKLFAQKIYFSLEK